VLWPTCGKPALEVRSAGVDSCADRNKDVRAQTSTSLAVLAFSANLRPENERHEQTYERIEEIVELKGLQKLHQNT
jgi:hypothetical protein